MAGELAYKPATGELVYSPATGQLALDCAEPPPVVTCPAACADCAATFHAAFEDTVFGMHEKDLVQHVGDECHWLSSDGNPEIYCQEDAGGGQEVINAAGATITVYGPLWVYYFADVPRVRFYAPVSPDNLACPPTGTWPVEWPYTSQDPDNIVSFAVTIP